MPARPQFIARDVDVVPAAALIAEPARAAMITALLDERPLAAGELARLAGVSPATASAHLARLLNGGLVKMIKQGRHRYYHLAGPEVAAAMEALAHLSNATPVQVRSLRESRDAAALAEARTCYDHLAGRAGVALLEAMLARRDPGARPGRRSALERGPARGGRHGGRRHGRRLAAGRGPPRPRRAGGADPPRSICCHCGRGGHADIVWTGYRCAGARAPPLRRRLPGLDGAKTAPQRGTRRGHDHAAAGTRLDRAGQPAPCGPGDPGRVRGAGLDLRLVPGGLTGPGDGRLSPCEL